MTLKEAAATLNTSPDNLRGAIHRGTLRATKLGRDWTVTAAEVERYRRDHRREPDPRRIILEEEAELGMT